MKRKAMLITRRNTALALAAGAVLLAAPFPAEAMHISEGILPPSWAALWFVIAVPFVAWGLHDLRRRSRTVPEFKALVGLFGAAVFVISCMPVPVPTAGTCSHPCGTGLAAIFIGAPQTVVITSVALILQALFLMHGGLSTLGADIVSMGIAGAFTGAVVFHGARRLRLNPLAAAFLAGLLSDWATYSVTSFELASALHAGGSFGKMFAGIALAFVPTQLPLGILEGFLCAGAYKLVSTRRPELLALLAKGYPVKNFATVAKLIIAIGLGMTLAAAASAATWEGVDESVVEKFAEQAGRPPQPPLINTDRGDLLLFLFLLAGATGGFVGGYLFRGLFAHPKLPRQEVPYDPTDNRGSTPREGTWPTGNGQFCRPGDPTGRVFQQEEQNNV